MGVIVGAGTSVSNFPHAVSVNWGASPNTQRLYVLGSSDPYITIKKPTATLSVTTYSQGPNVPVGASTNCSPASKVSASVTAAPCGACGGAGAPTSSSWYLTSYSFSKDDPNIPGQESFSMMDYIEGGVMPTVVLRGIAEGSWTDNSGVTGTSDGTSSTGSVSAGGIGRADTMFVGTVTDVGAATLAAGETGQASVSVPYTPIYC